MTILGLTKSVFGEDFSRFLVAANPSNLQTFLAQQRIRSGASGMASAGFTTSRDELQCKMQLPAFETKSMDVGMSLKESLCFVFWEIFLLFL